RNKLCIDQDAQWLFCKRRHDSVARRIIQITRKQYLANDIPLSQFVTIWCGCLFFNTENTPHNYESLVDAISNGYQDNTKTETITNFNRILNKRLSRIILYGRKEQDLINQCCLLQRCVEEIERIRDNDKNEFSILKIMLLYGGDTNNIEPIY
ncbi:unnamed protein product, partial [Rotaria sp. Silwood2]